MPLAIGSIKNVEIAPDGWSAWVTLSGIGKNNSSVQYTLDPDSGTKLVFEVNALDYTAEGEPTQSVREVVATRVVRKAYPNQQEFDHKIVGEDLVVRVALSEFVAGSETFSVRSTAGWATVSDRGTLYSSLAAENATFTNSSAVTYDSMAPIANFATPDRQLVDDFVYVEVIAASAFAQAGSEVAGVEFTIRDQSGNSSKLFVDQASISKWGVGDAQAVSVYAANVSTEPFHDGDELTVSAEVIPHFGAATSSRPAGTGAKSPTAFVDQVFLLDKDGSFGKSFAYVDPLAVSGSGVAHSDAAVAAASPSAASPTR